MIWKVNHIYPPRNPRQKQVLRSAPVPAGARPRAEPVGFEGAARFPRREGVKREVRIWRVEPTYSR